jgi:hypothetical protein
MVRTQIQLSSEQARRIRAMARREGVSMAEIIRRAVDALPTTAAPEREALWASAAGALGAFRDPNPETDVAARHDAYLDESYG